MEQLIQQATTAAGCTPEQGRTMAEALAALVRERAGKLDSVAVPGFGTFAPEKVKEHVETDSAGRNMLMPPGITLKFNPGSMLRKHLSLNE